MLSPLFPSPPFLFLPPSLSSLFPFPSLLISLYPFFSLPCSSLKPSPLSSLPLPLLFSQTMQLRGLGSAVSSPSGFRGGAEPQTHFPYILSSENAPGYNSFGHSYADQNGCLSFPFERVLHSAWTAICHSVVVCVGHDHRRHNLLGTNFTRNK